MSLILILIDMNTNDIVFRKLAGALVFLILFIFIGFRYEIGLDWAFYSDMFDGQDFTLAIEPGYSLLSLLMSNFLSYWWFQALITLGSIISFMAYFRLFTGKYVSCILIFFVYQFGFNSEALRQVIALTLVLLGYVAFLKQNSLKCYILIALACTFHVSALIAIMPIMFMSMHRIAFLRVACIAGMLLAIFNIYVIDIILSLTSGFIHNGFVDKVLWYGNDENAGSILTFSIVFKILIVLLFELRWRYFNLDSVAEKNVQFVFVKASIYSMLLIDIYLGRYGTISTRLEVYMLPAFIVSMILVLCQFKIGINRVLICMVIAFYLSFNFFNFSSGYYFDKFFLPYDNYLFRDNNIRTNHGKYDEVKQYINNKELFQ